MNKKIVALCSFCIAGTLTGNVEAKPPIEISKISSGQQLVQACIKTQNDFADAINKCTSKATARKQAKEIKRLSERMNEIQLKMGTLSPAESIQFMQKYMPQMQKAAMKMEFAFQKFSQNPELEKVIAEEAGPLNLSQSSDDSEDDKEVDDFFKKLDAAGK